jgi:TonB-dependent starch-binding outer membrane protein SusC
MKKTFTHKTICAIVLILVSVVVTYAQTITVTGTVQDESGSGLPGVNILVKGTREGTTTDSDGKYRIDATTNSTLVFTFIGYSAQEVQVNQQSTVNITLKPDITELSEVVVIGYGTQRKSDLTGAVSIADPKEMAKQAASNVTQLMQGRIAGVSITSDGQPGANPNVRIRGVGTFGTAGTSAEPLYVVDGFPLMGGIRDINPNDIETIQVLKDATSGAIYGNRAANGVVIITTKSGKKDEPFSVGLNAYYGFQKIPQRIPVLGRVDYQMISNEARTNAGLLLKAANDPSSPLFVDDVDTDWQDAGYKDGHIQNYNAYVSGGTKNTNFYMSMDYLDNVGTLVGTGPDYKRYSFRVNSETKLGRIKLGENVFIMRGDEHPLFASTTIQLAGNRPSLVNDLLQAAPIIPLYDPAREGGYGGSPSEDTYGSITLNVPGINTLIENSTFVNRLLANIYGELEIAEGLNFRSSLQYDKTSILDELFVPTYDLGYFFTVPPSGQLQIGTRNSSSMLIENTLSYDKVFGEHDLKVLVGQTYQDFDFREVRTFGTGLQKPYIRSLGEASSISATDNQQPAALASFLGRVNYAYKDRYLLTVNIRRDGSSKFSAENRWDFFQSLGLAWKIHNNLT